MSMTLKSIVQQEYPIEKIEVILIDNGSEDNSYEVFTEFQAQHPNLRMWYYVSHQGKAKALNKGIFSSKGKYIINIDSDGWLDKHAVRYVVEQFEAHRDIACMTGVILVDHKLAKGKSSLLLDLVRKCELFEYIEAFLIGRNCQSFFNSMFTLAGAFSCFRKEILNKTAMYNFETVGEDTHMTYQIREYDMGKVVLCEKAFFYVDPIDNLDKLYTQRQRWQRGELEVASLYVDKHIGSLKDFFTKFTMRIIITDHTLTFPRLIWVFAMIYLYFINYPLKLLVGANLLIYACYVFNSFLYLFVSWFYLSTQKETRSYCFKNWYICFIIPVFRFLVYWMRIAGIINSITADSKWKTETFSSEMKILNSTVKKSFVEKVPILGRLRKVLNEK